MGGGGSPTINQTSYRWCNDDGTISVIADEDADITGRTINTIHILALELENTGSAIGRNLDYQLQFRNITDIGDWTNVGAATDIKYADATNLTNHTAVETASHKGTNATGSAATATNDGVECEDALDDGYTLDTDEYSETWFAIDGGTAGKNYELRVIEDNAEVTVNYIANEPQITYAAAGTDYTETPADTETITDGGVEIDVGNVQADSVAIADVFTKVSEFKRALSDTEGIVDSASMSVGIPLADTEDIADSIATSTGFNVTLADSVGIVDSEINAVGINLDDSEAIVDSYADDWVGPVDHELPLSDSVGIADALSNDVSIVLDDAQAIVDNFAKASTFERSLADTIGIVDSYADDSSGQTDYALAIVDSVSIKDRYRYSPNKRFFNTWKK